MKTFLVFLSALVLAYLMFNPLLSLSGDNAEFIILARSIEAGEGMTYTHLPVPRPSTKYPPILPYLLSPVSHSITAMKMVIGAFYVLGMVFCWLWTQRQAVVDRERHLMPRYVWMVGDVILTPKEMRHAFGPFWRLKVWREFWD